MPFTPQVATITCPTCGTRFLVEVLRVIDVGQNPEYKQQLLSGRLNMAVCPQCGKGGVLAIPFLYHDPSKELALVFMPVNLNLQEFERQQLIGSLTNEVMRNLPPEQRKSYLLQPQIFLRFDGLVERILEADGITREMLEAQRARVKLLGELFMAREDEVQLKALATEHRKELDYAFFSILTANLESALANGQRELAEQLLKLRNALLEFSDLGRASRAQQETLEALEKGMGREELLERTIAAEGEPELRGIVSAARPLLDYQFFLMLSNRIEAAEGEEAQRLQEMRKQLLALIQELDRETEAVLARSSEVLQAILESEDREAAVREHLAEIDDTLLTLLSANIHQAEAQGLAERVAELKSVWDAIINVLEETIPPEIRLINRLLDADTEEERQALLEEQAEMAASPQLMALMEAMATELDEWEQTEAAEQLRSVQAEVAAFLDSRGDV